MTSGAPTTDYERCACKRIAVRTCWTCSRQLCERHAVPNEGATQIVTFSCEDCREKRLAKGRAIYAEMKAEAQAEVDAIVERFTAVVDPVERFLRAAASERHEKRQGELNPWSTGDVGIDLLQAISPEFVQHRQVLPNPHYHSPGEKQFARVLINRNVVLQWFAASALRQGLAPTTTFVERVPRAGLFRRDTTRALPAVPAWNLRGGSEVTKTDLDHRVYTLDLYVTTDGRGLVDRAPLSSQSSEPSLFGIVQMANYLGLQDALS